MEDETRRMGGELAVQGHDDDDVDNDDDNMDDDNVDGNEIYNDNDEKTGGDGDVSGVDADEDDVEDVTSTNPAKRRKLQREAEVRAKIDSDVQYAKTSFIWPK